MLCLCLEGYMWKAWPFFSQGKDIFRVMYVPSDTTVIVLTMEHSPKFDPVLVPRYLKPWDELYMIACWYITPSITPWNDCIQHTHTKKKTAIHKNVQNAFCSQAWLPLSVANHVWFMKAQWSHSPDPLHFCNFCTTQACPWTVWSIPSSKICLQSIIFLCIWSSMKAAQCIDTVLQLINLSNNSGH